MNVDRVRIFEAIDSDGLICCLHSSTSLRTKLTASDSPVAAVSEYREV